MEEKEWGNKKNNGKKIRQNRIRSEVVLDIRTPTPQLDVLT